MHQLAMEDDGCHARLGLSLSIMSHTTTTTTHDHDHDHEPPPQKQPIIIRNRNNNQQLFHHQHTKKSKKKKKTTSSVACLDLSFKLFPKDDDDDDDDDDNNNNKELGGGRELVRKSSIDDDAEEEQYKVGRRNYKVGDSTDKDEAGGRKKLRLDKEQSSLLESRFKLQTTLNTAQKQALAEQLKLTPRQVEVWFQNRRARTKLKQTEVDCEFLKKWCESLNSENRRLKTELRELRFGRNDDDDDDDDESCAQALITTICQSCHQRKVSPTPTSTVLLLAPQPYHSNNKL